jgi:hypothetical protein
MYGTEDRSCLESPWKYSPVWLNPPYSNPTPFLAKAAYEAEWHGVTTVALIKGDPATRWWNSCVKDRATLTWIPNRIRFYLNGEPTPHAASFPSVLAIYWGISWRPDALEKSY